MMICNTCGDANELIDLVGNQDGFFLLDVGLLLEPRKDFIFPLFSIPTKAARPMFCYWSVLIDVVRGCWESFWMNEGNLA